MRWILLLPIFIILFSCNDDERNSVCQGNPEFDEAKFDSIAYTNQFYKIRGEKFCIQNLQKVFVNGIEIDFDEITDSVATFTVPTINEDFITLEIGSSSSKISINRKIPLVKAGGSWKEVTPFPDVSQTSTQTFAYGGKGYILGGVNPGIQRVDKLYEYNPESNSWKLYATNEIFKQSNLGAFLNGSFYLMPGILYGFNMNTKVLDKLNTEYFYDGLLTPLNNELYLFQHNRTLYYDTLKISEFNVASNNWKRMPLILFAENMYLSNVLEFEGNAYLIFRDEPKIIPISGNSYGKDYKDVRRRSYLYDRNLNKLIPAGDISNPLSGQVELRYMFTLGHQAYFSEKGLLVEDEKGTLFIYDFLTKSWSKFPHKFPDGFYRYSSFAVNERGFAGISLSFNNQTGSLIPQYSTKFYEFIPN